MDADEQLLRDVEEIGWHVLLIPDDEEGPAFAFTVGLYYSFEHAELLIMGLNLDTMHQMLNIMGDAIKAGERYIAGRQYADILEAYPCTFVEIARHCYDDYLGYAQWFYKGANFPALQCVWPDRSGRYPWAENVHPHFVALQPILDNRQNLEPPAVSIPNMLALYTPEEVEGCVPSQPFLPVPRCGRACR